MSRATRTSSPFETDAEAIEDPANRELAESVFRDFETKVMPHASTLRRGVCQNDANDQNVVARVTDVPSLAARCARREAAEDNGAADFSILAISCTPRVNEIAISMAYFALGKDDPVGDSARVRRAGGGGDISTHRGEPPFDDARRGEAGVQLRGGAYSAAMDPSLHRVPSLDANTSGAAAGGVAQPGAPGGDARVLALVGGAARRKEERGPCSESRGSRRADAVRRER